MWEAIKTLGWFVFICCVVLLFVLLIYYAFQDLEQWQSFKVEHNCKLVGKTQPQSSYGMMSNGQIGMMTTAGRETFLCDDGVTYTR